MSLPKKIQGLLCLLGISLLSVPLPTIAATPQNEIVYFSDAEGNWQKLESFFKTSNAFEQDAGGQWVLKKGYSFVYGGDVMGAAGVEGDRVLDALNHVAKSSFDKQTGQDRFISILGNRDIDHLGLIYDLEDVNRVKPGTNFHYALVREWAFQHKEMDTFREHYGSFDPAFKAMEAKALSEFAGLSADEKKAFKTVMAVGEERFIQRRAQLGANATDADVIKSFEADMKTGGKTAEYLKRSKIAYFDAKSGTLFTHGAVTGNNFMTPSASSPNPKNVLSWVNDLNTSAQNAITKAVKRFDTGKTAAAEEVLGAELTDDFSLMMSRLFGDKGEFLGLDAAERAKLLKAGVKRVAIGHTPLGSHTITVAYDDGLEILMADNSGNKKSAASIARIRDDGSLKVTGENEAGVKFEYERVAKGKPQVAGRVLPDGRIISGLMETGEYELFHKGPNYRPIEERITEADVRKTMPDIFKTSALGCIPPLSSLGRLFR